MYLYSWVLKDDILDTHSGENDILAIIISAICGIGIILIIVYGAISTHIDCEDSAIVLQEKLKAENKPFLREDDYEFYC